MTPTRRAFLAGLAASACAAASAQVRIPSPDRPNIILVLVDGLGWSDTSVAFEKTPNFLNKRYRTPHLERLAREGLIFTNAYANPLNTPSVSSVMTGMNAGRHRVIGEPGQTLKETALLIAPAWAEGGLPGSDAVTQLPELMRRLDYTTLLSAAKINPLPETPPGEKPFFLLRTFKSPSTEKGDDRFMPDYASLRQQPEGGPAEQSHAANIARIDAGIGETLEWITRGASSRKTVILFTSTCGGQAFSPRIARANFPFTGGKGSLREGGIRVPLLAWCPDLIAKGARSETPVTCDDLFPTLLELADELRPTTRQSLDGRSFAPLLKGRTVIGGGRLRPIVWHQPAIWAPAANEAPFYQSASAIRIGDFKLIHNHTDQSKALFDLSKDPAERKNLAAAEPIRLRDMSVQLTRRLKEMKAQMPRLRATGQCAPYPDGSESGDYA